MGKTNDNFKTEIYHTLNNIAQQIMILDRRITHLENEENKLLKRKKGARNGRNNKTL